MIRRIIDWSIDNRLLVLALAFLLAIAGIRATQRMTLDAIPDLSDVQVIVKTPYPGQAPEVVEDRSPIRSLPHCYLCRDRPPYAVFDVWRILSLCPVQEGTDPYWARSRVLEYWIRLQPACPKGWCQRSGRMPPVSAGYSSMRWWIAVIDTMPTSCGRCRIFPEIRIAKPARCG